MKITHLSIFFTFAASLLCAGEPGSYASVTSTLTVTSSVVQPALVLANGHTQTKAAWGTYKVTNAVILAEAQQEGLIPAGDLTGWKILAVFDRSQLAGFVASNGLKTVWLDDVMKVDDSIQGGIATKGKWVETSDGKELSGSTTYLDGYVFTVRVGGTRFLATVAPQITDKLVSVGSGVDPVWRQAAFKISPVGITNVGDGSDSILRGSLSIGAAKSFADLSQALLGFPGFDLVDAE